MTEQSPLYNNVAPLRNVSALVELIDRVRKRSHGLPGMATFYGPSGYGKTTASIYAANRFDAVIVQIKSVWTGKKLCSAILSELGLPAKGTIGDMVDTISDELGKSGRVLILDEVDHLVARKLVEIVRDIYESAGSPVILIGEELLPQKLSPWERVHGRQLDWVAAQPGNIADVGHLARIYCPGIDLDAELQADLLKESNASIRRISVNLDRIREFALTRSLTRVTRKDWGKSGFFTGAAPAPRRISA